MSVPAGCLQKATDGRIGRRLRTPNAPSVTSRRASAAVAESRGLLGRPEQSRPCRITKRMRGLDLRGEGLPELWRESASCRRARGLLHHRLTRGGRKPRFARGLNSDALHSTDMVVDPKKAALRRFRPGAGSLADETSPAFLTVGRQAGAATNLWRMPGTGPAQRKVTLRPSWTTRHIAPLGHGQSRSLQPSANPNFQ
jgi:hypothetical protein